MNKCVESDVKEKVFPLFQEGKWEESCKILKKLSFEINNENTTEEKRLVYYNLAWVLDELGNKEMARKYITIIKNIIEEDIEYRKTNEEKYLMVLNLYNYVTTDKEKIEDKEKLYLKIKDNVDYLDQAIMAKYDICRIKNDYEGIVDLCEVIHNYKCYKKINMIDIPGDVLDKLGKVQAKLISVLKENSNDLYEELLEELLEVNNSMTNVVDSI